MSGSPVRRLWVGAVTVAALLIVAGWFLLISPQRLHAARLREQASLLQRGNADLRGELALMQAEARDLPRGRAKFEELRRRVPGEAQLPELLGYLTSAASNAGVELVAVTPLPPTALDGAQPMADPPADLQQIPLTVQAHGGYVELAAFLDQIEGLPRAVLVTSVSLAAEQAQPGRPPGENGQIDMTITARTFLRPRDPLLPTPAPAPPPAVRPTPSSTASPTPSSGPSLTASPSSGTSSATGGPTPGLTADPSTRPTGATSSATPGDTSTARLTGRPGLPPGTPPPTAFPTPRSTSSG